MIYRTHKNQHTKMDTEERSSDLMEIIYFELNNWFSGEHYPNDEPFLSWLQDDLNIKFLDEEWVKKNCLCVVFCYVDMSQNFCITATQEWVENNCPKLLTDYTKFLRYPDEYGDVYGWLGHKFLTYEDVNIGITEIDDED